MSKTFWAIIAVIILIFASIIFFSGDKSANTDPNGAAASSHLIGDGASGVVLVEYGDYECQFCGQYYPIVKEVLEKYRTQITFQFRNLPLIQIHKHAFAAARAAEAADKQGKFWEMHDMLFENQAAWVSKNDPRSTFEQYAAQLGLNVEQFKTDAASASVNDRINADIAEFRKTGAEMSTPTFFIDGKQVEPRSVGDFSKLLDEAIAAKKPQ